MKTYKIEKDLFDNSRILENGNITPSQNDVYFWEKGKENFEDIRVIIEDTEYPGVMNVSSKEILISEAYQGGFRECDDIVMPPGSIFLRIREGNPEEFELIKILESEELFEEE